MGLLSFNNLLTWTLSASLTLESWNRFRAEVLEAEAITQSSSALGGGSVSGMGVIKLSNVNILMVV